MSAASARVPEAWIPTRSGRGGASEEAEQSRASDQGDLRQAGVSRQRSLESGRSFEQEAGPESAHAMHRCADLTVARLVARRRASESRAPVFVVAFRIPAAVAGRSRQAYAFRGLPAARASSPGRQPRGERAVHGRALPILAPGTRLTRSRGRPRRPRRQRARSTRPQRSRVISGDTRLLVESRRAHSRGRRRRDELFAGKADHSAPRCWCSAATAPGARPNGFSATRRAGSLALARHADAVRQLIGERGAKSSGFLRGGRRRGRR